MARFANGDKPNHGIKLALWPAATSSRRLSCAALSTSTAEVGARGHRFPILNLKRNGWPDSYSEVAQTNGGSSKELRRKQMNSVTTVPTLKRVLTP